jgi:26S proteasome regulatory subunit N2
MSMMLAPSASVATASGWLALLQEPDIALRNHALNKLLDCVDTLWHEVAESLPDLEALAEDADLPLPMRQTAAAVASRVFFHLGEPSQALRLALDAGGMLTLMFPNTLPTKNDS